MVFKKSFHKIKKECVTAEIITIGTELLNGKTNNSNAFFLLRKLTELGFRVRNQSSCEDRKEAIHQTIKEAFSRSTLIVLTGGLGPTPDDVTREALASFFRVPLKFSAHQYRLIQKTYRMRKKRVPKIVRDEAMFPQNASPLINRDGMALGFYIASGEKLIIVLPGVPREMESMFYSAVEPRIRHFFPTVRSRPVLIIRTMDLSEPEMVMKLGSNFFQGAVECGIYPELGETRLEVWADRSSLLAQKRKEVKRKIGKFVYSYDDQSLVEVIGKTLRAKKEKIAVSESCTGGLLAYNLTKAPGASRFFLGGIIAYDNLIKDRMLSVKPETIKRHGAVSKEVAEEMASSIREKMGATYGIGVTGIAGPGGGSFKKPVGLVYVAICTPREILCKRDVFLGKRTSIQEKMAKRALKYLWQVIRENPS